MRAILLVAACALGVPLPPSSAAELPWLSPARCRIVLRVDPRRGGRSESPASVRLDFAVALAEAGIPGAWHEDSIEVVAYDAAGEPAAFDSERRGHERYLLPWRIERLYGAAEATLRFVLPSERFTAVAVYVDSVEAGTGQPGRYRGLVGDGDFLVEDFGRRELGATHFDAFADLDGDRDLDLFQGGVEPFLRCLENTGGNRYADRGWLSSGGKVLTLPRNEGNNRSWVVPHFHDLDGDGDLDLFPSFTDGPYAHRILFFENATAGGWPLTFADRGPLATARGTPIAGGPQEGGWFPSVAFVEDLDGDGDGHLDLVVGSKDRCWLYRGIGRDASGRRLWAEAEALRAGGEEIILPNPCFEVADVDSDGDRDLLAAPQSGQVLLYENVDEGAPRRSLVLAAGRVIAYGERHVVQSTHPRVTAADFTGDGHLDLVVDRAWELADLARVSDERDFGALLANAGTRTAPRWERRDARHGAPCTEGFPICDAVRQNVVRAFDWDSDGRTDVLAGDADGFVWWFRNATGSRFPVFARPVRLRAGGGFLSHAASGGHARPDVCDYNGDGLPDLLVADGSGAVTAYLNEGTRERPALGAGRRVEAVGADGVSRPIALGTRAHLLACDWSSDGKLDLVVSDQDSRAFHVLLNVGKAGEGSMPRLSAPRKLDLEPCLRPNLGSFVDWDGDRKKDLIACEFESSIRLYRNAGSGAPGEEPVLRDRKGAVLVKPWTVMMISGADAVDWNRDGDLDLLTGQGHGGSGIRFYERDFIEDELAGTHPVAAVERVEAARPSLLDVVRRYADAMLEHGRDVFGPVKSGLFLSALDRRTLQPLAVRPSPPGGIRREDRPGLPWRPLTGANPHLDENLLRVLYTLGAIDGDSRYAAAADHEVKWFLENAQSPATGLLAWGEHLAWDVLLDRPISGSTDLTHELARPWVLWDRSFELAPEASRRFALGLWEHQIANRETGGFDRHAPYDRHGPTDGKDFARHAGFYIHTWAHAYHRTRGEAFLRAIEVLLERFERKRAAAPGSTLGPLDATAAAALVPEPLVSRLRAFADEEDRLVLEDLRRQHGGPGGAWSFRPTWQAGYSSGVTAGWAMYAVARLEQSPGQEVRDALRDVVVAVADAYVDSLPDEDVDVWPMSLAHVISAQVAAYRLTGRGLYLAEACRFARLAVQVLWEESPLPRASFKTGHYETITGADSLALALLEVHAAGSGLKVPVPTNTIDR
ncbi:MAG: VCBS repeat-containing protein [Planctomycetes bacterium]|nr:VCBS repeat-containing protein [Planctomycetota bacterium]